MTCGSQQEEVKQRCRRGRGTERQTDRRRGEFGESEGRLGQGVCCMLSASPTRPHPAGGRRPPQLLRSPFLIPDPVYLRIWGECHVLPTIGACMPPRVRIEEPTAVGKGQVSGVGMRSPGPRPLGPPAWRKLREEPELSGGGFGSFLETEDDSRKTDSYTSTFGSLTQARRWAPEQSTMSCCSRRLPDSK